MSSECTSRICLAPRHVGRWDEDLAVEAAGAKQRRVELLQQVRRRHHDDVLVAVEAVHLDEQLVQGLVALAGYVRAALGPDGVKLVDEDDRRGILACLLEQATDPRRAEPGEHLDKSRRRLAEELRTGLVRDRLGEQRLAGAGRAVEQDALRDLRAEPLEVLRLGEKLDDLPQLLLRLLDPGDVVPRDRALRAGVICCGFVLGISFIVLQMKKTSSPMKITGT